MRYELRFLVHAPAPADARDLGNAILDGVRAAERRECDREDSLYQRVHVDSVRLTEHRDEFETTQADDGPVLRRRR